MSREPKPPRVVLVDPGAVPSLMALWKCTACGVLGGVTLPIDARAVSRACDAFGKAHAQCKAVA